MLGMPEAVSRSGEATETYREAYDQGFRDGRIAGARDRAQNRRFDLANEQEFQSADHGFDEQRHEREVFILGYRRGFEDGYEQGYGLENEGQEPVPSSPMSVPVADDSRPPARTIRRSRARDELLPAELKIRLDLLGLAQHQVQQSWRCLPRASGRGCDLRATRVDPTRHPGCRCGFLSQTSGADQRPGQDESAL